MIFLCELSVIRPSEKQCHTTHIDSDPPETPRARLKGFYIVHTIHVPDLAPSDNYQFLSMADDLIMGNRSQEKPLKMK